MKQAGSTPPLHGLVGEPLPHAIAETAYLRLGGVDQWVMIRGAHIDNPPLILLYGGPGMSETVFFRYFAAPLEQRFTVVYWDQRGSGKSLDPSSDPGKLTVEQFVSDLDELVDIVRERVGQNKVALFGHSWGSALGALYCARFPQKVAAYVGCEQIGDWPAAESASYEFALAEAQRRGNKRILKKLQAIGAPPYSADSVLTERLCLARLDKEMSLAGMWKTVRAALGVPEVSLREVFRMMRGFRGTLAAMWPEVSKLNLIEMVPALEVPVFFFTSRRDHWVPAETSVEYFDALEAPSKHLVWFDKSGHEPFVDEPDKFNRVMLDVVAPALAAARPMREVAREHLFAALS